MSTARLTALGVAATVFVWSVWAGGLPTERIVVIAWLLLFAALAASGRPGASVARAVTDWLPLVVVMVAYDLSRGAADGLGMPVQRALPIRVDEAVFGTVPTVWLQERLGPFGDRVHWWEVGVSLVYLSHFLVPFALGVWLWARHRERWIWWRDRFVTLTAAALVVYVLAPTAPPWMAARDGLIEPVQRTAARGWQLLGIDIADRVFDLGRAAVNPVAALPSLHAGYALLVALAAGPFVADRWRPVLLAYPVTMGLVLVVSGEHYVFDVVAGWAVVWLTLMAWRRLDPRVALWRAGWERRRVAALVPVIVPVPDTPPVGAPARGLPVGMWWIAAGAGVAALISRGVRLGTPDVLVFDELFYATQALEIAQAGVEHGHTVHPPVAKWMIAGGIRLVGFSPLGWRLVPWLAGAAVAALTAVAAARATSSRLLAAVAALVVLTDGIAVTTGRLALLDGIAALFATGAFALLVGVAARPLDVALLRRTAWPIGLLFGLAVGSKWSVLPVWLVSAALVVWLARSAGMERAGRLVVPLGLVPLAVYAASFVPTVVNYDDSAVARAACADGITCATGPVAAVRGVVHDHLEVLRFHTELEPTNRYAVSSWNWIVQTQPTELFVDGDRRLTAIANPVVWLVGTVAMAWCAWWGFTRRRPVPLVIGAWWLAWWAPWAIGQRPGYSFYAAPLVPVLAVGLVSAIAALPARWRHPATGALVTVCVVGAIVLAPRWYALG